MKHRNIIHRIIVDKEMMIKAIASLLYHEKTPTKKAIRDHISWERWCGGYSAFEDQMTEIRNLYPAATDIYYKLYPEARIIKKVK